MVTGRVIEVRRTNTIVASQGVEYTATVRGSFHQAGDFPKVGDYVKLELVSDGQAVITEVLPRKTIISRRASDSDDVQVIVTNVDLVCVVMGLDGDFNINRLERYLHLIAHSGAKAIVILNKKDLPSVSKAQIELARGAVGEVPVLLTSAISGDGLESLRGFIKNDTTAVLLGSSGSGKSTITNWLLGENQQETQEIREDDSRGRHTTTSRQLFALPGGGYIIDTPGMRELGAVGEELAETELWQRVGNFAAQCRFRNCDHEKSDGCAVIEAIKTRQLTKREVEQYLKLQAELEILSTKADNKTRFKQQNNKRKARQLSVEMRRRLSGR